MIALFVAIDMPPPITILQVTIMGAMHAMGMTYP